MVVTQDRQGPAELVEEEVEMPLAQPIQGAGLHQPFARILADGLEEAVPALAVRFTVNHHEGLTDQPCQKIEHVHTCSAASSVHEPGNTDSRLSNCRSTSDNSW